ncbi:hypothetical protein CSQ89_10580 [Chitinimonas sp. BJB300]|nr:hypothetical protein CSQ89_10580 [Chitinimonas sp. BJB300]
MLCFRRSNPGVCYMGNEDKFYVTTRDDFNLGPIAEKIIALLEQDIKASPLLIEGGWGSGKTEFCKHIINLSQNKIGAKIRPVYINAFHADNAGPPILTLLAAILELLSKEEDREKIRKAALPILRLDTTTLGKTAVSWVSEQYTASPKQNGKKEIQLVSDAMADHMIESMLKDHEQVRISILALQKLLAAAARKKTIVLFVDELDRCLPHFTMLMLKTIQHLFDVPGIKFVFIANAQQLLASTTHCYGTEIDAQRYLDKFIRYRFQLPTATNHNKQGPQLHAQSHFLATVKSSALLKNSIIVKGALQEFIFHLIEVNQHALREVERFVVYLEVYQSLSAGKFNTNDSHDVGVVLLAILAVYCVCFLPEKANATLSGDAVLPLIEQALKKDYLSKHMGYHNPVDIVLALFYLSDNCTGKFSSGNTVSEWKSRVAEWFSVDYPTHKPLFQDAIRLMSMHG